ncbi:MULTISPECIES: YqgE/AlgH family protein [unclassified Aureimonas]|uniref:YqgE/AlgH family protein n=1 Tax=unclassified Aureimonas TaxID=2615206 RepID=UPI0007845CBA|nr:MULTISPECIES: YqgE/AlgH family protein [unclassified Aureimonas]
MDFENIRNRSDEASSLEGHFLIAMPGMEDERFSRSVVYICAHSSSGAMGFIVNKAQPLSFAALLTQLEIVSDPNEIRLPQKGREVPVCQGGPVEQGRGFVLHSEDYDSESTVSVDDGIALTPTLDILKAISSGVGPSTAIMVLGYAGWSPGQLESEIAANGWLTCRADLDIVFDAELDNKYTRALAILGINPAFLTSEAGHA